MGPVRPSDKRFSYRLRSTYPPPLVPGNQGEYSVNVADLIQTIRTVAVYRPPKQISQYRTGVPLNFVSSRGDKTSDGFYTEGPPTPQWFTGLDPNRRLVKWVKTK